MSNPDQSEVASAAATPGTQALARGLGVLLAVAEGATDLRAIGAATGTTRATTHRLASFLRQEGWLRQTGDRSYALGPRLIQLGAIAKEQVPLTAVARPHLLRLAQLTGNTIHLGIVDGLDVLYLEKIPGTTGQEMRSRVGSRMPLAGTGVGKALMLGMPESEWEFHYQRAVQVAQALPMVPPGVLEWEAYRTRMQQHVGDGFAIDLEENEIGIRCISAPIRDVDGAVVAAISVASTVPFMSLERIQMLADPVRACARDISGELGWA